MIPYLFVGILLCSSGLRAMDNNNNNHCRPLAHTNMEAPSAHPAYGSDMAMDQEKPAVESTKEDLYVGIVVHLLKRLERNKRVDIYPVASTTMLYQLPHDHTDETTFEWVDTFQDLNPPPYHRKTITTCNAPQLSASVDEINFLKDQKDGITTHKVKIHYNFYSSYSSYSSSSSPKSTYEIPLGHAYMDHNGYGWKTQTYEVKAAKFGPAPTIQFLPGSTFEPGDNIVESTVPNESLMKCPSKQGTAITIAFLKMQGQYDSKKQRVVLKYVPEGTQNKDHSE